MPVESPGAALRAAITGESHLPDDLPQVVFRILPESPALLIAVPDQTPERFGKLGRHTRRAIRIPGIKEYGMALLSCPILFSHGWLDAPDSFFGNQPISRKWWWSASEKSPLILPPFFPGMQGIYPGTVVPRGYITPRMPSIQT
jgi:hypothetical protein